MSLRAKISWLFIGLVIVPMLIFAALVHRQSLAAMELALEVRLDQTATAAARMLSRETEAVEETLRIIATLAPSGSGLSSEALSRLLDAGDSERGKLEYLEVMDANGTVTARAGPLPADGSRCGSEGRSTLIQAEVSLSDQGDRLVGGYWPASAIRPEGMTWISVVDGQYRTVFSSSCDPPPVDLGSVLGEEARAAAAGTFRFNGNSGATYGAYAPVNGTAWTVVIAAPNALRDPVTRLFQDYSGFVVALGAAVFLAFSMILGRITRSIEGLTRAAEHVGAGELRPWLPPPGTDEIGKLTLAFSRMTDSLRSKLELVDRNGRLAVMGQLSSYLAHEIRNPLSAVKMNLQRLQRWQRRGQLPEHCKEPIDVSLKEVDRLASTVASVLQLGRTQDQLPDIVSVHELVTDANQLLENEFDRLGVDLRCELDARGDRIRARPGQVKGAIINLMLNALDAQPNGGELLIRSALTPGSAETPGPRLELRFIDRGPGVPTEIRDRILEPFFTTKENGSGIGLAVASQGIRDNGGELYLEEPTRFGGGAEFVISFPLAALHTEAETEPLEGQLAPWMEQAGVEKP